MSLFGDVERTLFSTNGSSFGMVRFGGVWWLVAKLIAEKVMVSKAVAVSKTTVTSKQVGAKPGVCREFMMG